MKICIVLHKKGFVLKLLIFFITN